MSKSPNLNRHARVAALANVQKLVARAALGRARAADDEAQASLLSARADRDDTRQFWQERLVAPILDPVLVGQLAHLLAEKETAHDKAEKANVETRAHVLARQTDLGEAEGRHSAIKRALAKAQRRSRRKREEAAAAAHECATSKRVRA
ncbi:MAG: hypothetical protein ABL889_04305 [Terricaulis sp.]